MKYKISIHTASIIIIVFVVALVTFALVSNLPTNPRNFQPLDTSRFSGQQIDALTCELGTPDHEMAYTMDECVGELRVTLFNTYPPDMPELAKVEIRELTWDLPSNKFTAWLHRPNGQWVILETFRYDTEAVF